MARVLTVASNELYNILSGFNDTLTRTFEDFDKHVMQLEATASDQAEERDRIVKLYEELKEKLPARHELPEEVVNVLVRLDGELS